MCSAHNFVNRDLIPAIQIIWLIIILNFVYIFQVVIRRLPPTLTKDAFINQTSPLPEYDYFYFVRPDKSLGQFAFSRAYINFTKQEDIFTFKEQFDNYTFLDKKGKTS